MEGEGKEVEISMDDGNIDSFRFFLDFPTYRDV